MPTPIPDNHLSASRVNTFGRCPMQYYFRYCLELTSPPSGALSLGSSFHIALEHYYKQKLNKVSLEVGEVLDAFSTDFDERIHDTAWWKDEQPGKFKDQGVGLLKVYHKDIAVDVQPTSVEHTFEIPFENKEWTFTGRTDLIAEGVVREAKTIGQRPSAVKAPHKLQIVMYATANRYEGNVETGARVDYAVKNKTPICVSYPFQVQDAEVDFFLKQVSRVALMIENEMFMNSRHLSPFPCSHKFCGYATRCEKTIGGIVAEG